MFEEGGNMRILKVPDIRMPEGLKTGAVRPKAEQLKRKIKVSWEDLILALALIVILTSWLRGTFTAEQVLAYLGFTATGGMWGYVSASKSK